MIGMTAGAIVFAVLLGWQTQSVHSSRATARPGAYFPNCAAARDAGVAPIHIGDPGYREELDADYDGVACEPPQTRF
jgi:hypothetical protein